MGVWLFITLHQNYKSDGLIRLEGSEIAPWICPTGDTAVSLHRILWLWTCSLLLREVIALDVLNIASRLHNLGDLRCKAKAKTSGDRT